MDHVPSFTVVSLFTKRQKAREEAAARARGEPVDYLVREAPQEFPYDLRVWLRTAALAGPQESTDFLEIRKGQASGPALPAWWQRSERYRRILTS